jgi:hypothetical protein
MPINTKCGLVLEVLVLGVQNAGKRLGFRIGGYILIGAAEAGGARCGEETGV